MLFRNCFDTYTSMFIFQLLGFFYYFLALLPASLSHQPVTTDNHTLPSCPSIKQMRTASKSSYPLSQTQILSTGDTPTQKVFRSFINITHNHFSGTSPSQHSTHQNIKFHSHQSPASDIQKKSSRSRQLSHGL